MANFVAQNLVEFLVGVATALFAGRLSGCARRRTVIGHLVGTKEERKTQGLAGGPQMADLGPQLQALVLSHLDLQTVGGSLHRCDRGLQALLSGAAGKGLASLAWEGTCSAYALPPMPLDSRAIRNLHSWAHPRGEGCNLSGALATAFARQCLSTAEFNTIAADTQAVHLLAEELVAGATWGHCRCSRQRCDEVDPALLGFGPWMFTQGDEHVLMYETTVSIETARGIVDFQLLAMEVEDLELADECMGPVEEFDRFVVTCHAGLREPRAGSTPAMSELLKVACSECLDAVGISDVAPRVGRARLDKDLLGSVSITLLGQAMDPSTMHILWRLLCAPTQQWRAQQRGRTLFEELGSAFTAVATALGRQSPALSREFSRLEGLELVEPACLFPREVGGAADADGLKGGWAGMWSS